MHERIKQLRARLNLTQAQFAERLNLSRNYIAVIEIGQREPSDRTILDICREFGVSESWLRTGAGSMIPPSTRKEDVAKFIAEQFRSEPDGFKLRLISALSKLDEPAWEALERFARQLVEDPAEDKEKEQT